MTLRAAIASGFLAALASDSLAQRRFVEWPRHVPDVLFPNLACADVDRDGDIDIVSLRGHGSIGIHINDGEGQFSDESALRAPPRLSNPGFFFAVRDIDGDGDLDILAESNVLVNDGRGYFRDETAARYPRQILTWFQDLEATDIDRDGDIDLLLIEGAPQLPYIPHLWINDGRGYFRDGTSRLRSTLHDSDQIFGDIDNDGDVDLISSGVTNRDPAFVVLNNDGRGFFSLAWTEPQPDAGGGGALALLDYDADGDLDLYISRLPDRLYRNDGQAGWREDTSAIVAGPQQWGGFIIVGDFTQDGRPDILKVNTWSGYDCALLINDGRNRLVADPTAVISRMVSGRGGAAGDLDGDGDLDMATAVLVMFPPSAPKGIAIDMNLDRQIVAAAPPKLGQPYNLDLWSLRTPAGFLPFAAIGRAVIPLPDLGILRLDPTTMVALGAWPITGSNTKFTLPLPIPSLPVLQGVPLSVQAAVVRDNRVRLSNAVTQKIQ